MNHNAAEDNVNTVHERLTSVYCMPVKLKEAYRGFLSQCFLALVRERYAARTLDTNIVQSFSTLAETESFQRQTHQKKVSSGILCFASTIVLNYTL